MVWQYDIMLSLPFQAYISRPLPPPGKRDKRTTQVQALRGIANLWPVCETGQNHSYYILGVLGTRVQAWQLSEICQGIYLNSWDLRRPQDQLF